ncbi:MAG: methyltransferase domain-containing protein [Chloroflexi bacterium]|nr:methyltransferase domain-containing protein [Chloroflexota bacterium]
MMRRLSETRRQSPRQERLKGAKEVQIERRWRDALLQGGSSADFRQAYDELHREFLRQQGQGAEPGEADIYGQVNPRAGAEDRVRAVLLRAAGSGKRILEVGTGDGLTSYLLAQQGNEVITIDVSEVALQHARVRWGKDTGLALTHALGDARELSWADASFDLVISENLVEHISPADMRRHLAEVRRVLISGGHYVLYTPSRLWSGRVSAGFHLHVYTLRELCAMLREHGFVPTWIEPRLLHRTGRLISVGGLGLRFVMAYEALLGAWRVHRWPYALKARVIPSVMVSAQREEGA